MAEDENLEENKPENKSNRVKLIEKILKTELKNKTFPTIESIGYPNLNTLHIDVAYEIKDKWDTQIQNEFLALACFDVVTNQDTNEFVTKWGFFKFGFMNKRWIEDIEKLEIPKTNIELIDTYDDWKDAVTLFKRHCDFYLDGERVEYISHIDTLNFKYYFGGDDYIDKLKEEF